MRLISILFLYLLLSSPARAAFSLVSNTCAGSSNGGVSVTTSAINTTGTNLIIIGIADYSGAGVQTPTDNQSNTWTKLTTHGDGGGGKTETTFYYSYAPTTNASHTFTESGATNFAAICVMAFSGSASSPFDVQNGNGNASATSLSTGSVTPSQNNEVVVALLGGDNSPSTASINGGFTIPTSGQLAYSSGQHEQIASAYLIQTTATAANPTWTNSSTATTLSASIATFESSVAPTGGGTLSAGGTVSYGGTITF